MKVAGFIVGCLIICGCLAFGVYELVMLIKTLRSHKKVKKNDENKD